ncbi:major capsid protein P2 [Shewanella dokdonensis]|uniref:Viral coat protein P2 N-terminal domain-containing protein n=1 Tax=Shewanella dokdonensis TaxID=712036 RepID=A0ABX8DEC1_9GAMM|nr:major capsid protein P2 [Shewanella dokdonensis]MCL1072997.1 major capsid protein P2 [Shewanella dokdonensis]QVK23087.1 hypothetical protein KHX94_18645 [Shewanella dokdonensis]
MARQFKKLPSFSNVTAGNTATLELPLGLTYDKIHINFSGVTLAQMKNLRVEVNGKPIREYKTAQVLQDENKYYGRNVSATVVDLCFNRDEMKTLPEARSFGLGTSSAPYPVQNADGSVSMVTPPAIANVTISMDIDGAATNPVLTAYAILSNPAPIGFITKVKNYPITIGAGLTEVDKIVRPETARIAALHVITAATIEKLELEMDSIVMSDMPKNIVEKIQVDNGRAPQAGRTALDFFLEGDMLQALPMKGVQDLRLRISAAEGTASGTPATLVVEYFDGYAGI